jgi:hypothetical protein
MHPNRPVAFAALLSIFALTPGIAVAHPGDGSARQGPWSVELTDESGRHLPTFELRGRTYVLGEPSQRYLVRVRNETGRRTEVVVSVDGLDVTDGKPAAWERRGYLVEPYGEVTIDGFRLSQAAVAAFRFGSVAGSYAASKGNARDVGVIGVAVFPERAPAWRPLPPQPRYPYPSPYPYPQDEGSRLAPRSESAPAPSAAPSGEGEATGPQAPSARRDFDRSRPGLGTEFGEAHGSPVYEVAFERASSQPAAVLTLRYDDRRGLLAAGVDVDRYASGSSDEVWRREQANPFRSSGPYSEPPPGWRGW